MANKEDPQKLWARIKALKAKGAPDSVLAPLITDLEKMSPSPVPEEKKLTTAAVSGPILQEVARGAGKAANLAFSVDPYVALSKYYGGKMGVPFKEPVSGEDLLKYLPGTPGEAATAGEMIAGKEAPAYQRIPLDIASAAISPGSTMGLLQKIGLAKGGISKGVRNLLTGIVYPDLKALGLKKAKESLSPEDIAQGLKLGLSEEELIKRMRLKTGDPVETLFEKGLAYGPEETYLRSKIPLSEAQVKAEGAVKEVSKQGGISPWDSRVIKDQPSLRERYISKLEERQKTGEINTAEKELAMQEADKEMQGLASDSLSVMFNRLKELNKRNAEFKKAAPNVKPVTSSDKTTFDLLGTLREGVDEAMTRSTAGEQKKVFKEAQKTQRDILEILPYTNPEAFARDSENIISSAATIPLSPKYALYRMTREAPRSKFMSTPIMGAARGFDYLSKTPWLRNAIISPVVKETADLLEEVK